MAATPQSHPPIHQQELQEVQRIIKQGALGHGPAVESLQSEFAAYTGARFAVAVSSGTAALHLALLAHGIGPGDYVVTTPLCIPAVASAILATGARPLFVDVDLHTCNISPLAVDRALERRTRRRRSGSERRRHARPPEWRDDRQLDTVHCGGAVSHFRADRGNEPCGGWGGAERRTQNSERRTPANRANSERRTRYPASPRPTRAPEHRGAVAALLAVDLFGQPCDLHPLAHIAGQHNLSFIQVAWDSLGSRYDAIPTGASGTTCFSFQQGMPVCTGEGGMLCSNNRPLAEMVRRLAHLGCDGGGRLEHPGFNYRMTNITATLARGQLGHLDLEVELRRHWAQELNNELRHVRGLRTPGVTPPVLHTYHRYAVRITPEFPLSPAGFCHSLQQQGFEAVHTPLVPLQHHPCFQHDARVEPLDNVETLARELVLLPLHQALAAPDMERLVDTIRAVAAGRGGLA